MPMIDVYAATGTFPDSHSLARDLAAAVMRWEQVPDLPPEHVPGVEERGGQRSPPAAASSAWKSRPV